MQKFERSKCEYDMYGETVSLTKPSLRKISAMQERLRSPDQTDIIVFIDFLVECGMPQHVAEEVEFEHANQLVLELCGAKKN